MRKEHSAGAVVGCSVRAVRRVNSAEGVGNASKGHGAGDSRLGRVEAGRCAVIGLVGEEPGECQVGVS